MKENIRVYIVDDSAVFRSQIRAALEGQDGIEVVGFATDGRMACDALKHKKADVVTLDLEMPVMNGLDTLAELKRDGNLPYVIVISAMSKAGAETTLAALKSGASDFMLKPTMEPNSQLTPAEVIRQSLVPKVRQCRAQTTPAAAPSPAAVVTPMTAGKPRYPKLNWTSMNPSMLVIASSTGGPAALEKLFSFLRGPLSVPVLIAQHMPPIFTATLAERLHKISGIPVCEAKHMQSVERGNVYVAPGDFHMSVNIINGELKIILDQEPLRNSIRPAADFLFESAAKIHKNALLGVVLTGMGADGKDGALAIKESGGAIVIQDKESCVVFGMPGAVHAEQAYDAMTDIEGIAMKLAELSICAPIQEMRHAK